MLQKIIKDGILVSSHAVGWDIGCCFYGIDVARARGAVDDHWGGGPVLHGFVAVDLCQGGVHNDCVGCDFRGGVDDGCVGCDFRGGVDNGLVGCDFDFIAVNVVRIGCDGCEFIADNIVRCQHVAVLAVITSVRTDIYAV